MDTTNVSLIMFDLDGTLVDTAPGIAKAANAMLGDLGLPTYSLQQITNWVGNGIPRLIKRVLTGELMAEPDAEQFATALDRFEKHYLIEVNDCTCETYAGVKEALETFHSAQIPMVCITNKTGVFTTPLLKKLDFLKYFSFVLSGDSLPAQKPDPLPLLHSCKQLGVEPVNALFVGDSSNDVKAARAAQIRVVCVPYGYNHGQDIRDANPDLIINTLMDLPPLLKCKTTNRETLL
jgi:phosphoglycolate phosphatase